MHQDKDTISVGDHYERDTLLTNEGEEVISKVDEDEMTADASEDDEIHFVGGLGEGSWASTLTTVEIAGDW